ncbi:FG-GAP repeat domain-containing protein [Streptomyces sp. NPDC049687]|uniref:FG-GAP repeat domain-containing protein n=1 Tax=Streptomyces sp. NPDC049687 TaxID=3365596 RepID=UPI0037BC59FA
MLTHPGDLTIDGLVVAVGDLDGDGRAALLAQDRSNTLWRYDGNGTGGFTARAKVADRWGASYDSLVGVGDLPGDGRADVVSRDTSGNVWRSTGNGKSSFAAPVKIATGRQAYGAIF